MRKNKYAFFYLALLLLLLLSPAKVAEANDNVGAETKTQAGFVEGTEPSTSSSTSESTTSGSTIVKPQGKLPSTGELVTAGLSGIVIITLAGVSIMYKLKHKKTGEK